MHMAPTPQDFVVLPTFMPPMYDISKTSFQAKKGLDRMIVVRIHSKGSITSSLR